MVDQLDKMRANSEDWKKARQVVIENRMKWAMNTFMPYNGNPICLQKGLGIIIKYLIEVFRDSSNGSHIYTT